jgi:hypothetical protein
VVLADLVEHVGARERRERLRVDVREQHERAVAARAPHDVEQRAHRRRVDRRHVPQADQEHLRPARHLGQRVLPSTPWRCTMS